MEATPPRPGRWLWLGTLSLAATCFAMLVARHLTS
jgi:Ca-activated chloride channel family protein